MCIAALASQNVLFGERPTGKDFKRLYVASGVLVRLGATEFVLTAGHNVYNEDDGKREDYITVHAPPPNMPFISDVGDGSVKCACYNVDRGRVDPDVAVIELSPLVVLRHDREPFEEHEIGFLLPDAPQRVAVLVGFPRARTENEGYENLDWLGRYLNLVPTPIIVKTPTRPGRRALREPSGGRGIRVYVGRFHTDASGEKQPIPHPEGMSGGPLVLPEGRGVLIGLARSCDEVDGERDEWCEPATEPLRFLAAAHESPTVREAAARVLVRCGLPVPSVSPVP